MSYNITATIIKFNQLQDIIDQQMADQQAARDDVSFAEHLDRYLQLTDSLINGIKRRQNLLIDNLVNFIGTGTVDSEQPIIFTPMSKLNTSGKFMQYS